MRTPNVSCVNFSTLLSGLGFGLALIVAIGAQNALVLRQGLRREHVGVVVAICVLSDMALIAVGAAGVGSVIASNQTLLRVVTITGACVLLFYGVQALRRAIKPEVLTADEDGDLSAKRVPLWPVVLTTLTLTWLNPHVYLDTVVLLGSVSATYAQPWTFAGGAMLGSVLWFTVLGFGAALLRPLFARPTAWRIFDSCVAIVMVVIAVNLLLGLR